LEKQQKEGYLKIQTKNSLIFIILYQAVILYLHTLFSYS
jgi:hypothetical protein